MLLIVTFVIAKLRCFIRSKFLFIIYIRTKSHLFVTYRVQTEKGGKKSRVTGVFVFQLRKTYFNNFQKYVNYLTALLSPT
jgi:hypothetical protein